MVMPAATVARPSHRTHKFHLLNILSLHRPITRIISAALKMADGDGKGEEMKTAGWKGEERKIERVRNLPQNFLHVTDY